MGTAEGKGLGSGEGRALGATEGVGDGARVGAGVGKAEGRGAAIAVGRSVGLNVGSDEGLGVGRADGRLVGAQVDSERSLCTLMNAEPLRQDGRGQRSSGLPVNTRVTSERSRHSCDGTVPENRLFSR